MKAVSVCISAVCVSVVEAATLRDKKRVYRWGPRGERQKPELAEPPALTLSRTTLRALRDEYNGVKFIRLHIGPHDKKTEIARERRIYIERQRGGTKEGLILNIANIYIRERTKPKALSLQRREADNKMSLKQRTALANLPLSKEIAMDRTFSLRRIYPLCI